MRIVITDTEIKMKPAMSVEELTNRLLSVLLAQYNHAVAMTPEEHKSDVKELIYDMFNYAASALLDDFIPEKELRPDLTADAIMAMENKILDDATAKE